jgi:hypothetical protein
MKTLEAGEASRCLITLARAKSPGGPAVAAWDLETKAIRIIQLPRPDLELSFVTGAAANQSFLFLAVQIVDGLRPYFYGESFFLLVVRRQDLSFAALHPLPGLRDVHSICLHEGRLYVVSTGTDEVIAFTVDGPNIARQEVAWRPVASAPREDIHHVNTLISWNGSLIVSGFGEKQGALWSSADNGFLHDITAGRRLLSGVRQPHSFLPHGGDLLFCESRSQGVRSLDGLRVQLDGYTRGLGRVGGRIAVGVSRGRRRSRSTDQLENWGSPGGSGGKCGVYWLSGETLAVESFTDIGFCGDEIYEILPVDGLGSWPVMAELDWRDAAISGFDRAIERVRLQYQLQIAEYQAALDKLNTDMCAKVAEANEIIRDLYGKLDEQTRWAQSAVRTVEERDRTIRSLQEQREKGRPRPAGLRTVTP